MAILKKWRFILFYILSLGISIYFAFKIDQLGINENLVLYYDFIGDILNFSSILTGFLGAVISILTSISRSSKIITTILKNTKAFRQFILCMAIPFLSGVFTIIWSMIFRLKLNNADFLDNNINFNVILITSTLFFVLSSMLMTITIFYIFFKEDNKSSNKGKKVFTPSLKKN